MIEPEKYMYLFLCSDDSNKNKNNIGTILKVAEITIKTQKGNGLFFRK